MLTDLDLGAFVDFHEARGAAATISLARVDDPSAFGVVPTRDDGEVIAFVEKPPREQAPTNWINAGTYVLEPSVLASIPPRLNVSIERETFPRMLESPGRLYAMKSAGYWLDIGTPAKYFEAHLDVLEGKVGLPPTPDAQEQAPGVWVEPGATIDGTATLTAPVLIGARASIGAGATIRRSVVGADASVAAGATVSDSVIFGGVAIEAGETVHGSAVGNEARLALEGAQ